MRVWLQELPTVELTMHLVDRVGTASAATSKATGPVGLTVPEWKSLNPRHGAIPRAVMNRMPIWRR